MAIVLIDMWNRYRSLGAPVPGYKEMWSETKKMCAMAWNKCKKEPVSAEPKTTKTKQKKVKTTPAPKKSSTKISRKKMGSKKVTKRKKKK